MTAGVLTSETVPVNWTIERTDESALRESFYVQMQAAYDAIDELGFQQAASLITTQMLSEVNSVSSEFTGSAWAAPLKADGVSIDFAKADAITRTLLMSGATLSDLGNLEHIRYFQKDGTGAVIGPARYGVPMAGFVNRGVDHYEFEPTAAHRGNLVLVDNAESSVLFFVNDSGQLTEVSPFSADELANMTTIAGETVPNDALPGDILKSSNGNYYLVDIQRELVEIDDYFRVMTVASAEQSTAFGEILSGAINELTKNGQIEAARMQQLVNLLQILLGGASNTEAKESKAKETILSRIG